MVDRLLLALLIAAVALALFLAFRAWHLRRVGRAAGPFTATTSRTPAVLYFRSGSCAPCITQAQYLEALAQRYAGRLAIRHIDADRQPEQAGRYGVFTLPTTLILDPQGEVRYINYGLTAARKLAAQLEKVL
jgi:thioredoxin 1